MKVNKFYILLLFVSFIVKTIAQQEAQYTQYMYNLNIINLCMQDPKKAL